MKAYYKYVAYEKAATPMLPSEVVDFDYPEQVAVHIAKRLAVLGDGRSRIKDMVAMIWAELDKAEQHTASRVADALTTRPAPAPNPWLA